MNIPLTEAKATYTKITETHRSEIRLDLVMGEIQITVYSCPIGNIDSLIEKLQALQAQVAPTAEQQIKTIKADYLDMKLGDFDLYEEREKRIQNVNAINVIQMEVVKEFSTLIEVEDDEPAIMTTVLGEKPDPTGWYRNALQKAASVPAPVKNQRIETPAPDMPLPKKGMNIINIIGVKSKDYTSHGTKYPGTINMKHNADIAKQRWIRIYGIGAGRTSYDPITKVTTAYTPAFDLTFKMGDTCVYDSYNLVYTGKIVGIGAKTITIEKAGYSRNTVLDIATFIQRNYDYDAKAIFERNSNWSD